MNIIEAIKSGKPIRRKVFRSVEYLEVFNNYLGFRQSSFDPKKERSESNAEFRLMSITVEDILANDWEIKSKP